jgi:hypothetical protein
MIDRFLGLYAPESPRWDDISVFSERFQWVSMTNQTTSVFLEGNGVAPLFARELVEAATRVNYGQVCHTFQKQYQPTDAALERGQDPRPWRRHFNGSKWCIWCCSRKLPHIQAISREFNSKGFFEYECWSLFVLDLYLTTDNIPGQGDQTEIWHFSVDCLHIRWFPDIPRSYPCCTFPPD